MGYGSGYSDREYRSTVIDFKADVSSFAPFDHYRLTQKYLYERGRLQETVLLYKRGENGEELPFARMDEDAQIFVHRALKTHPTEWAAQ